MYGIYISFYIKNEHFKGGSSFNFAWVGGAAVATALATAPLVRYLVRWSVSLRIQYSLGELLWGSSNAQPRCVSYLGRLARLFAPRSSVLQCAKAYCSD